MIPLDDGRVASEKGFLFYDADCGFCRWTVARMIAWDRGGLIRAMPIQGPAGERLLAGVDPAVRLDSWHFVESDGAIHSAGAAVPPLLRLLPGGRPLAAIAARWPRATERVYRFGAGRRRSLGGLLPSMVKRRADQRIGHRVSDPSPGSGSRACAS